MKNKEKKDWQLNDAVMVIDESIDIPDHPDGSGPYRIVSFDEEGTPYYMNRYDDVKTHSNLKKVGVFKEKEGWGRLLGKWKFISTDERKIKPSLEGLDIDELNEEQITKLREWLGERASAIPNRYDLRLTPVGLGFNITVEDLIGNEKLDLSDYDSW